MINLLISIFVVCSSFGYAIAKTNPVTVIKKHRQHNSPLSLDKEVI